MEDIPLLCHEGVLWVLNGGKAPPKLNGGGATLAVSPPWRRWRQVLRPHRHWQYLQAARER